MARRATNLEELMITNFPNEAHASVISSSRVLNEERSTSLFFSPGDDRLLIASQSDDTIGTQAQLKNERSSILCYLCFAISHVRSILSALCYLRHTIYAVYHCYAAIAMLSFLCYLCSAIFAVLSLLCGLRYLCYAIFDILSLLCGLLYLCYGIFALLSVLCGLCYAVFPFNPGIQGYLC